MRKYDELVSGCMSKAHLHEMTFVLLARDKSAPVAIRAWIKHRIKTKKNTLNDSQIKEAELCALIMEQEQSEYHEKVGQFDSRRIDGQESERKVREA